VKIILKALHARHGSNEKAIPSPPPSPVARSRSRRARARAGSARRSSRRNDAVDRACVGGSSPSTNHAWYVWFAGLQRSRIGTAPCQKKKQNFTPKWPEPVEADTSKSRTASPQDAADFDSLWLDSSLGDGFTDSPERSKSRQRSRVTNGSLGSGVLVSRACPSRLLPLVPIGCRHLRTDPVEFAALEARVETQLNKETFMTGSARIPGRSGAICRATEPPKEAMEAAPNRPPIERLLSVAQASNARE
jgi:hypothetical protein